MANIENLEGIIGSFEGHLRDHPDPKRDRNALADGTITYERTIDGESVMVTILIKGVRVRRLGESRDFRRYVRVVRGPKENRDKIIGLIDKKKIN